MNLCISFARHRAIRTLSTLTLLALAISFFHHGLPWAPGIARNASAQKLNKSSVVGRTEGAMRPFLGTGACDSAVIDVEANGVTTPYTSLAGAFAGINAAVHTGDIVIEICGDASHSSSAVLNSSGAGSANYTSVVIRPLTDGATISGTTVAGRGVIELNGADNVTIDGDNPLTEGINRNLTIQNTAPNTVMNASVIRIALNTTSVASADNNIFKNLIIVGNATGLNIATATGSASPANQSFGIAASGGANGAATSPNNLSIITTVGSPATAANLLIENNEMISVGRAVAIQGAAATVFEGLIIRDNRIGNPTTGSVDQVYSVGVTVQGATDASVLRNVVWIESYLAPGTAGGIRGLDNGLVHSSGTGTRFEENQILRVLNNNPANKGASGITLHNGHNHWVINNFVTGVRNQQVSGNGFSSLDSVAGIRTVQTSTGHRILHNSVHMWGEISGSSGPSLTAALAIWVSGNTGMDVRNNILSNQFSGGASSGTKHAVIYLPSGVFSSFNLKIDNNAYFAGTAVNSRLAQVGAISTTGDYLASDFDPAQTTPASNFRSYTSSLISPAVHLNDIASFASMAPAPFVSDTDLHLTALNGSQIDGGGADAGVAADIDGDARGAEPDIGADEQAAPTAAEARVAGRVATAGGRGVSGARVRLSGGGGQAVYAVTNPFGYYRFAGLAAGETYVVEVSAKRYTFAEPVRVVTLFDSVDDLDFVAEQW